MNFSSDIILDVFFYENKFYEKLKDEVINWITNLTECDTKENINLLISNFFIKNQKSSSNVFSFTIVKNNESKTLLISGSDNHSKFLFLNNLFEKFRLYLEDETKPKYMICESMILDTETRFTKFFRFKIRGIRYIFKDYNWSDILNTQAYSIFLNNLVNDVVPSEYSGLNYNLNVIMDTVKQLTYVSTSYTGILKQSDKLNLIISSFIISRLYVFIIRPNDDYLGMRNTQQT